MATITELLEAVNTKEAAVSTTDLASELKTLSCNLVFFVLR